MSQPIYTKQELLDKLKAIRDIGWIENRRAGNVGGIGNTLEDLLGITENNLPLPNSAEWELKTHRKGGGSLTTLFHTEPSPRAFKIVPSILLPYYGWKHDKAGTRYPSTEMSFRQTINAVTRTDRGFGLKIDYTEQKILVSFDPDQVSSKHNEWLKSVEERIGKIGELEPQPYWGFDDLFHTAGTKLLNCFYIDANVKKEGDKEYYLYQEIYMLKKFSKEKFIKAIENGIVLVDFDARTGHNHGTKFRIREDRIPILYEEVLIY